MNLCFIHFLPHLYLYVLLPFFLTHAQYFHGVSTLHEEAAFTRACGVMLPLQPDCIRGEHQKEKVLFCSFWARRECISMSSGVGCTQAEGRFPTPHIVKVKK